ncbi:MAG: tRNA pseudouridine38-40 synthase [Myxococcota bacterium]
MIAEEAPQTRWALTVAWDGAPFHGWQRQPHGDTIQQIIEAALTTILGGEVVTVTASGRTDAGVHALEQVVSFAAHAPRSPRSILGGLNTKLPPEIVVLTAREVPLAFNPRRWTRRKLYRYRVLNRPVRCPHRRGRTWYQRRPLDVAAMSAAMSDLVGEHDFTSFRAAGCTAAHPVRLLQAASLHQHDDELHFEFIGRGFLRYQVRNMVGTLVQVGQGRRAMDSIPGLLAAKDRKQAGVTAPAHGLWLVWVEVGDTPRGEGD